MKKWIVLGITSLVLILAYFSINSISSNKIDFNRQIRPLLNEHCLVCHGGVKQEAGLSFLFESYAKQKAKSGKFAIIPGKAGQSELIKRLKHTDPESRMPLDENALNQEEIKLFEQWINQGAKWEDHWAYRPPSQKIKSPKCNDSWCKNEIDHFILAGQQNIGLSPSEPAAPNDLLRRLYLDLIGLPPTKSQMTDFFESNSEDPGMSGSPAISEVIESLLDSEHFGEKWASMWLDLARYADSKGYQKDLLRPEIWRYRDWVIHAFNIDMPFDQFTVEQLAGDLLPDKSDDQILATAFHRNTMTNDEGGTDNEEFRVQAVIDRLNTTMEIWQGTTIACVQCHSHPYDPIEHEEFYQLYSYFNNTADKDDDFDSPKLNLFSPAQIAKRKIWKEQLYKMETSGDTLSSDYHSILSEYVNELPGMVPIMKRQPDSSRRKSYVFERGNWLVHGTEIHPDVPKSISNFDGVIGQDRLALANWIVDGQNPLTARVIVNRFWEQIFGRGLVVTLEDFGTQGDKPSHPELLDWLALRFINHHKWSVKSLLREIVHSATYQQSSKINLQALNLDPHNIFLSHGPRYRLSAEQIRDQALVISGLFNPVIYGRSVMPFQPEGVWNIIRHAARWEQSKDEDSYRRALYTFWRRVSPYPSMTTFDTPTRELCVSRRIRTNTPLQALVTLNDPVFVEAAESLAGRMMAETTDDISKQLKYGFELALMRSPDQERLNYLLEFYNATLIKLENEYAVNGNTDASKIRTEAMINVASVILNLDEVIMKT